jgi:hypothetical protein
MPDIPATDDNMDVPRWGLHRDITPCFGARLAQDWQSEVVITANQPLRQWFNRENLPERVHAARHAIEQTRLAYQAIRSAA